MKQTKKLIAIAISTVIFAGCQKQEKLSQPVTDSEIETSSPSGKGHHEEDDDDDCGPGHVYTLSNQVRENKVLDYRRSSNGKLHLAGSYSTSGTGTGGGLGNQGAVILAEDNETLLAVNPGSNSISSFKITDNGLKLKSTINSKGIMPVSITEHNDIVFVLNAGGNGNISGFRLGDNNKLFPIPNSTRKLSSNSAGAAQISFLNNGKVLVVTEKATNKITTYTVNEWGIPGSMHTLTSANETPFGFAVGRHGYIFVSEAAGGEPGASTVSSYRVNNHGVVTLVDGPVGAGQTAACWVVLTDNGKYAYSTNTASHTISSFKVNTNSGNLKVLDAVAATSGMGPIDAALSHQSKFLYVLNTGSHTISAWTVTHDGNLNPVQTVSGIPVGANGLAAK